MTNGHKRRIKALLVKESLQIIRDPSTLLISILLPIILTFLYAWGVSLDLDHLRIGIVLEDRSPEATSFVRSFVNSRYFEVTLAEDRRQLITEMERGAIRGMVIIPSYFSQFRAQREKIAPIQVIADGSEPNTATFVQNYVQGAFENWLQQEVISEDLKGTERLKIESRFWYNPELRSNNVLLPGSLAIIMTLIGILLTALVVAREWERGTMESLMATPVSITEILIGKLIPYFFLGIFSMFLCVSLTILFFQVPFRGSLWLLTLVTSAFLFCALSLGLMISTLAKNQLVAFQIAIVTGFLPAYMLSGFLFEITSMPTWIQMITYLMPPRYFVSSLQTLFLVGNIWELILWNMVPMLGIGMLFIMIIARKTVKRLD